MNSLVHAAIDGRNSSVVRGSFGRHSFPMHSHTDFAVCVVTDGIQGFTEKSTKAVLHRGCFASVNPGQVHDGFSMDAEGWRQCVLFFGSDTAEMYREENGIRGTFRFSRSVSENSLFAVGITDKISAIHETDDSLKRQCLFEEVLTLLHKNENLIMPHTSVRHVKAIKNIIDMLQAYPADKHSLDDLAAQAQMSKFHFLRSFKDYTGITPHAYLNQLRLDRAFQLLTRTDKTSAEIAAECGFSDQPHFMRSFKRLWGITPGSIKRK